MFKIIILQVFLKLHKAISNPVIDLDFDRFDLFLQTQVYQAGRSDRQANILHAY